MTTNIYLQKKRKEIKIMIENLEEKLTKHVKQLIEIKDSIKPNECTILTGFNGSGKSLIRKQIIFAIKKQYPDAKTEHVSMQLRTESNVSLGALCSAMHDLPWIPTSCSTYDLIKGLINNKLNNNKKQSYIVIDEPEIGMSTESQLAIAQYLKTNMPALLNCTYGVLIITHSETIVKELMDIATFKNINEEHKDISPEEWLNREIKPTDFEYLNEWSLALFRYLEK